MAAGATAGTRDLFVAGASRPKALAVYDTIDGIKVKPDWAMARVGGVTFPKMSAQFEAWAYSNGADGKPDSPDDIDLGIVDASWTMEEYAATYNDDDIKFVGTLNEATGHFTPNIEGPNPARSGSRNNVGDVWVVAKYPGDAVGGKPAPTHPGAGASARHRAAVHALRSDESSMTNIGLREFHSFEAAGRRFLYLVPSAAVFALDDCAVAI